MVFIYKIKKQVIIILKKNQFTDSKILTLLFIGALLFRVLLLLISLLSNGYDRLFNNIILVQGNDPLTYHQLALNLLNHNSFSYDAGLPPVTLRTPGYPLFISFIYFLFGSKPLFVIVFQIIIDSMTGIIIFKLTRVITNYKIALIALILYTFEPHASIYSLSMYSDTIFVFFTTLFGYLFIKFLKEKNKLFLIFSAITLGIATLIKPSSVYLPVIAVITIIFKYRKKYRLIVQQSLIFIVFLILVISPWLVRNYIYYNKFFLSTSGEYNLLVLNITPIKMQITNLPQDAAIYKLLSEADSLMKADGVSPVFNKNPVNYWDSLTLQYDFNKTVYWMKLALGYINLYPLKFIKFYSLGIVHSFTNVGTSAFSAYFNLSSGSGSLNIKSESDIFALIKRYFTEKNVYEIIIGLIISLFLAIVYTGCFIGIIKIKLIEDRLTAYFLLAAIIYFVLISGAGGLVRFKLPAIPFYLALTALGINHLLIRINNILIIGKIFKKH